MTTLPASEETVPATDEQIAKILKEMDTGCPDRETHQSERACACQIKEEGLGRFGYHPEPATDFCIEVGALEGLYFDATHGISKPGTDPITVDEVRERVEKAMQFTVGGDEDAVKAKGTLREIAAKLATLAHQPVTAGLEKALEDAASQLIETFDKIQSTTVAERIITGRSDSDLRKDGTEAMANLRKALAALKSEGRNDE